MISRLGLLGIGAFIIAIAMVVLAIAVNGRNFDPHVLLYAGVVLAILELADAVRVGRL